MLRNLNFLQGFQPVEPLTPPVCYTGEVIDETAEINGVSRKVTTTINRPLVEPINTVARAEDYEADLLIAAGVELKPSAPYGSVSLEELSELGQTLNNETYETDI